ncbi:MAG TPA: GAF domain-containing protein [Candidatus Dormibacteraeota bacterium]|jgi:PAS domain S-box-containing protein
MVVRELELDRTVFEAMPCGVLVHGPTGEIVLANQAAARILRLNEAQLLGHRTTALRGRLRYADGRPLTDVDQPIGLALATGQPQCDQLLRLAHGDGSIVWLQVDAVPILGDDGRAARVIATFFDVTPIKTLEDRAEAVSQRAEAVAQTSRLFSAKVADFDATLQTVVRRVAELVGDAAVVTLLSDDGLFLTPMAIHDPDPVRLEAARQVFSAAPYPAHSGPAGEVVRTGRPIRAGLEMAPPPGAAPMEAPYEAYRERFDIVNYIILPLEVRGRVIGTLGVSRNSRAASPYTQEDQDFMQRLADTAALAIANARLYAEATRRLEWLESLHQTEMAAVASLDLRLTLQVFLDQVRTGLRVDAAIVRLVSDKTQHLEIFASAGLHTRPRERDGQDWVSFITHEGFVTHYSLPLIAKGEVHGVLEILSRTTLQRDPEWLQFAETLAGQAAIAVDNSRLLDQVQRSALAKEGSVRNRAGAIVALNRSQQAILRLLVEGRSNSKIAKSVHLSENTVKFHIREIFHKLGVRNRVEAAMVAVSKGLV